MFANFNGASRTHLGGGDENVHLAHLQVERPQGVVVDVGDDAIQHAQPNGNALAGDLVNHRLHMLGSYSCLLDCICNYLLVKSEPVIFPEGIRTRARPRRYRPDGHEFIRRPIRRTRPNWEVVSLSPGVTAASGKDITPIARRDWIHWIVSAKQAETRASDQNCLRHARQRKATPV